jgi:hypothetical protein
MKIVQIILRKSWRVTEKEEKKHDNTRTVNLDHNIVTSSMT